MAKKDMDSLLGNILGSAVIPPQDKYEEPNQNASQNEERTTKAAREASDTPWKHFSFICSVELADKVQAIAHKEGFTIRALMEYMIRQGIATYESKNGKVRKIKHKGVTDVM